MKYWKWIVIIATGIVAVLTSYNMLQSWKPLFAEDLKIFKLGILKRNYEDDLRYWSQEVRSYQIHPPRKTGDERVDSVNRDIWLEDLNTARGHKKFFRQKLNDLRNR